MSLSQQLRDAVNQCGASINSLSKATGVEQSCLQRFATGDREHLSAVNMERLAEHFGMRLTAPRKIPLK